MNKRYIISYALDGTYMVKDSLSDSHDGSVIYWGLSRDQAGAAAAKMNFGE